MEPLLWVELLPLLVDPVLLLEPVPVCAAAAATIAKPNAAERANLFMPSFLSCVVRLDRCQ
jgi:hypothetical protein